MAKDPNADPGTSQDKLSQAYDCLGQLVPPLALIKMAAIAAMEGMQRNAPETVAHLTGGEYFPSAMPTIWRKVCSRSQTTFQIDTS